MYDTVVQYGQVLGAPVDDWHPPIMVRLWQLLHPLGSGTAPMFVLQAALYALGFGLIVAALARTGRWVAAAATSLLALSPLLLGWQMVVLKDAQMDGALLAAFGMVASYRLQRRAVPIVAITVATMLLAYATLVRTNALFSTVPLVVLLLPISRRPLVAGALAAVSMALVLAITPAINHRLLAAEPSDITRTLPVFDLAAIAVATPADAQSVFTPSERAQLAERHCVKSFFWDPLGEPSACAPVTERVKHMAAGRLYRELAEAAAEHPIAYARHRIGHWNATERWLVSPGLPDAAPPIEAEPNELGLGTPESNVAAAWQDVAAVEAATPLGWPIVWTLLALSVLPVAWRRRSDPAGSLALALLASAITLEASFLVISIASDIRYHLWPMTASALTLILLSDDLRVRRGYWAASCALVLLAAAGGVVARSVLPRAPDNYQGMIHWGAG